MNNQTTFDEILQYNKCSNYTKYIEHKELCEWLNINYTFCSDNFQPVIIDASFNSKNNCSYYKILLKNPNPNIKIKYISFVSLEDYKGPKFNIQYQNDDFINHETIIKIFEFLTNKTLNIIYQEKSIFDKDGFDFLIEYGYYYVRSYDKYYHIAIGLDFHIFEYELDTYIQDIQWTSDNRTGVITKNISENRDEFSCYN